MNKFYANSVKITSKEVALKNERLFKRQMLKQEKELILLLDTHNRTLANDYVKRLFQN